MTQITYRDCNMSYRETMSTPENKLWCAVVLQAWRDYFGPRRRAKSAEDIQSAKRFLMSDKPNWRQWREHVCVLARLDGVVLRARARAKEQYMRSLKSGQRKGDYRS